MIAGRRPGHPELRAGRARCVTGDHTFCWDWVKQHWGDTLQPALVQHVELTAIAVGDRLRARVRARARSPTARRKRGAADLDRLGAPLHVPEHRALPAARAVHRAHDTTVEIPLVAYTLVILFPNFVAGLDAAPPEVLEAARGMGLTPRQILCRVELPLALPAIIGGLRIAVVSTIAIATIAASIGENGLGVPDLLRDPAADAVQDRDLRGRRLAVALALALRRGARRSSAALAVPWARAATR